MGRSHIDFATHLNNIGSVLERMGRCEEALKYHQECMNIQEKSLGRKHPDFATSLSNIGNLLVNIGKYEEALKYHHESLAIR